jgi:monofunctional biosynthetic peptidoglycan transglycosylase
LYVAWGLPARNDVRALARSNPAETGVMKQRAAEALAAHRRYGREQVWVPITRVSRHLIHAVVAAEDPRFFGHEGVDWDAVKESVEVNVRKRGFVRGGSTITQQLAKNLFFSTRKSITRKLMELVVARWMEADLGKKRILEIYLNVIEWGDGLYGCEAAARRYYGKSAAALDEYEAAGLAAMIPSPRRINPSVNPARYARAQKRVLWLMAHAGYVRRDVGGLGSEPPPPEPVEDEESAEPPAAIPVQAPPAEPSAVPAEPSPEAVQPSPADEGEIPSVASPSPSGS